VTNIILVSILAIFATFRLARLISRDTIFDALRNAINRKAAEPDSGWYFIAEWMNCPHCVGVWIAFFIVISLSFYFRWTFLAGMLIWLAVAGAQSFLQSLVEHDEET
jgi:hypothetical protein